MKKKIRYGALITLCILLFTVTFAWYRNNRQTEVNGGDSVSVKGNGVLRTAFATDEDGLEVSEEKADYSGELTLQMGNAFENVSGDGKVLYVAALDTNGAPKKDEWTDATADVASVDYDNGQYVTMDLYFKSDSPMDIYLTEDAAISPVSNGNDLNEQGSYGDRTRFSQFSSGLPLLNINQSSFGLFSRNLIAAAARVSFMEYTYSNGSWTLPESPNVIWAPNSTDQLITYADTHLLYKMITGTGEKAETYQYHTATGIKTVDRQNDGSLIGDLYILKPGSSNWEEVAVKTFNNGAMVPGRKEGTMQDLIPQIYTGAKFEDAAYCSGLGCHVQAEYDSSFSLSTGFAYLASYKGANVYVQPTSEGYKTVKKVGGAWVDAGETITAESQVEALEETFIQDSAEYKSTVWMEDDMLTTEDLTEVHSTKIATTSAQMGSIYYARVKINIWVEGYDNEANIALNGGEFTIKLVFYGLEQGTDISDTSADSAETT